MSQKSKFLVVCGMLLLFFILSAQAAFAYSNETLRYEMEGASVSKLQKDLKTLGYMDVNPTGYYGDITRGAVIRFQKKYGLEQDGIAGKKTLGKLDSVLGRDTAATRGTVSRTSQSIISLAKKYLGVKYIWGGTTTKGFDCSGYVKYVFKSFGITLSRVSASQAKNGTNVKKASLKAGDLVFFDTNGGKNGVNHVGIYIGGGQFIHSSSSHNGVTISTLNSGFYAKTYMTARRVLK